MSIEFDLEKDVFNREKHGLMLALGSEVFDRDFIEEEEDQRFVYGETRFCATGPVLSLGDRLCVVVDTWRKGARRIISFRKANDREIRKYRRSHS